VPDPRQYTPSGYLHTHYATIFDGRTPVLCGLVERPMPAASEWRYVTCPWCLAIGAKTSAAACAAIAERDREEAARRAEEAALPPAFMPPAPTNDPTSPTELEARREIERREYDAILTRVAAIKRRRRHR